MPAHALAAVRRTAPTLAFHPPAGDVPAAAAPGGQTATTTGPATPSGPQIIYFRVAQQPRCPQGTTLYPVPGKPLVLEWKVSGGGAQRSKTLTVSAMVYEIGSP
ncbi:MAG TPA: hypothetical protein VFB84_10370 [Micromonosporaceae bacterium]|nr:hypothetical protein [Micromonosporaceae bacterium]